MLSHDTLENYLRLNFELVQHHKYSLEELENLIPYEREIYVALLAQWIEKEKQRLDQEKNRK